MTQRQMQVLKFIESFIRIRGFSPSYMDIAVGLNLKSKSNIHRLVHTLKADGYIKVQPHKVRSLQTVDKSIQKMTAL
jgi:repressor LexA